MLASTPQRESLADGPAGNGGAAQRLEMGRESLPAMLMWLPELQWLPPDDTLL